MFARTPDYRARTGIGIPPDRTYKITRLVDQEIAAAALSPAGERLLHVLIHEACQVNDRRVPTRGDPEVGVLRLPCNIVRGRLGLMHSTDNRAILRGLEELWDSGCFADAEILHRGRLVQWAFTDAFQQRLLAKDIYALLDINDVQDLHSSIQFWLHRKLGLVWRMRRPFLECSVRDLHAETSSKLSLSWAAVSRPLIQDLQRISQRESAAFFVIGHWDGDLSGIDRVTVRIKYSQTLWQKKAYEKTPVTMKKAYVVDAGQSFILASREDVARVGPFRTSVRQHAETIAA